MGDIEKASKLSKEDFSNLLKQFFSRITYVTDCFEIYKHLKDLKKKYLKQLNYAPAFFSTITYSLVNTFIIELWKLYDNRSLTSIWSLIPQSQKNKSLFMKKHKIGYLDEDTNECKDISSVQIDIDNELMDCRKLLNNNAKRIDNLRNQRNKFFAHLDKNYGNNTKKLVDDFPVTFKDIEILLQTANEICNKISVAFDESWHFTKSSNVFDIDNLLKKLVDK